MGKKVISILKTKSLFNHHLIIITVQSRTFNDVIIQNNLTAIEQTGQTVMQTNITLMTWYSKIEGKTKTIVYGIHYLYNITKYPLACGLGKNPLKNV